MYLLVVQFVPAVIIDLMKELDSWGHIWNLLMIYNWQVTQFQETCVMSCVSVAWTHFWTMNQCLISKVRIKNRNDNSWLPELCSQSFPCTFASGFTPLLMLPPVSRDSVDGGAPCTCTGDSVGPIQRRSPHTCSATAACGLHQLLPA